jgi:hypothetical protein
LISKRGEQYEDHLDHLSLVGTHKPRQDVYNIAAMSLHLLTQKVRGHDEKDYSADTSTE